MEIFFAIFIIFASLVLYFVFIKPFLKGYREGMTEQEKLNNTPILTVRLVKHVGLKNILFVALVVAGIFWIYSKNANEVNPNQHVVTQSNGNTYMRSNPNHTREDNIGTNRADTFWGIVLLVGGGIVFYRIFLKK